MTTNVPLPEFTPTGLVIAAEQAILEGELADYVNAFALSGKTLSTELSTPQGQLASSQSYMVANFQAALAYFISQVDPLTAQGIFQDALGRIYFLTRQAATFASAQVTIGGVPGSVLPSGAQIKSNTDGTIWATDIDVTIGGGGTVLAVFTAVLAGSGPTAGINDFQIYQQVPGWESVANAAPSIPGADVETRQAFESRRAESVQIGGLGTAESVRAAIANVPGVSDVFIYNNGSDALINYGATSYPIKAHSIGISVTGGDSTAIAQAINSKLDAGCGLPHVAGLGTLVSVSIQDTANYSLPYPVYVVRFIRPVAKPLYISVQLADVPNLPADYISQVQNVVATAFAEGFTSSDGTISFQRARIGGQVIAAQFTAPIMALGNNILPVDLNIGAAPAPVTDAVVCGIDEQPVCPPLNVSVSLVTI